MEFCYFADVTFKISAYHSKQNRKYESCGLQKSSFCFEEKYGGERRMFWFKPSFSGNQKVQNGVWLVNPNVLMKGNDTKRQILLSYYESEEPGDKISFNRTKQKEIETNTQKQTTLALEEKRND